MSLKNLAQRWKLPDRSEEKKAFSLRLNYDQYAKVLALKEIYPTRSINDLLNDIIEAALDEVIAALPSYPIDIHDAAQLAYENGGKPEDYIGSRTGPAISFQIAYARILNDKSQEDSKNEDSKLNQVNHDEAA